MESKMEIKQIIISAIFSSSTFEDLFFFVKGKLLVGETGDTGHHQLSGTIKEKILILRKITNIENYMARQRQKVCQLGARRQGGATGIYIRYFCPGKVDDILQVSIFSYRYFYYYILYTDINIIETMSC